MNATLKFENCKFVSNTNIRHHIAIIVHSADGFCVNPTNISIENCDFVNNLYEMILFLHGGITLMCNK